MISIVVTTFNIENYLEQCLKSILRQTYSDTEIIVIDDGSSDRTPEIISEYAEKDSRLVPVLLKENTPGGVATGANVGIAKATRKYIGFVDGDDWCEPHMFESLLNSAEKHRSDIVIGNFKNYDENNAEFYDPKDIKRWAQGLPLDEAVAGTENKKILLTFNPVPWRKLYRRDFIENNNIRFPEGDYFYEDNPFHWFCISQAEKFSLVDDVLCYHRMNRVGQSMGAADRRLLAMYEHHDTICSFLKEKSTFDLFKKDVVLWAINNTCWIHEAIRDEFKSDVIRSLYKSFQLHDLDFVHGVITSPQMGNKGRELALEALKFGGFEKKDSSSVFYRTLLGQAFLHWRQFGFRYTVARAKTYLYHRAPFPLKKVLEKVSVSEYRNKQHKELLDHLKALGGQMEFQNYLLALNEEFEKKVLTELSDLHSDVKEIKAGMEENQKKLLKDAINS